MTDTPRESLAQGYSEPRHTRGRRGLANLATEEGKTMLDQINRLDATGVDLTPRMRMAAGYEQGYQDAANAEDGEQA